MGALMGAPVAGRCSRKSYHIDSSSVWPTVRGGPPFGPAPTMAPVGRFLRAEDRDTLSRTCRGDHVGRPLRAEGFPKRRCQFESDAAQRHLSPRRPAACELRPAPPLRRGGYRLFRFLL